MLQKKAKKRASLLTVFLLISVGDLKYKIFLFKDFNIVKTAIKDTNKRIVKSVALFLAFF